MFRNPRKIGFVWAVCLVVLLAWVFPAKAQNHPEPLAKKAKPVRAVTASPPLISSGGTTPNISLPGVIIGSAAMTGNTAIGDGALEFNTTGISNTAIGVEALSNNTSGNENTAIG